MLPYQAPVLRAIGKPPWQGEGHILSWLSTCCPEPPRLLSWKVALGTQSTPLPTSYQTTSREGSARAQGLATNGSPAAFVRLSQFPTARNIELLPVESRGGSNLGSHGGSFLRSAAAQIYPLIVVPSLAAIESWRSGPNWACHNGPILAAANNLETRKPLCYHIQEVGVRRSKPLAELVRRPAFVKIVVASNCAVEMIRDAQSQDAGNHPTALPHPEPLFPDSSCNQHHCQTGRRQRPSRCLECSPKARSS